MRLNMHRPMAGVRDAEKTSRLSRRGIERYAVRAGMLSAAVALMLVGHSDSTAQTADSAGTQRPACERQSATARALQAEIDVTWAELRRVTPLPNLFAGEHACLKVSPSSRVNIDRWRYQERECWDESLGAIGSRFITRIDNHFNSPAQVPLLYALHEGGARHRPGETNGSTIIELPVTPGGPAQIRSSVALVAMIGRPGQFGRASCGGDPEFCSHGNYDITVYVNSRPRAEALFGYLSEHRLTYDEISDPRIQNDNLKASDESVRIIFARALLAQAQNHHGVSSPDRRKILELALEYAPVSNESAYQAIREDILGALGPSYRRP